MRLAKYLTNAGVCSRRQASRLIDAGEVIVNGQLANHIDHVDERDAITVNGSPVLGLLKPTLFAFHKPIGVDCKLNLNDPCSVIHFLPTSQRVYPIGRLDKDSRGLLLLTNNGELCHTLNNPEHHQEKEYHVQVDKALDTHFCKKMAAGIPLNGQITLPCEVSLIAHDRFRIVLKQGLNRQIRKMSKYCGYKVIDLYRVRVAGYQLNAEQLPEKHHTLITQAQLGLSKDK